MAHDSFTDCRDEEGILVGLIDVIINQARVFVRMNGNAMDSPALREALKDLQSDEDVQIMLKQFT